VINYEFWLHKLKLNTILYEIVSSNFRFKALFFTIVRSHQYECVRLIHASNVAHFSIFFSFSAFIFTLTISAWQRENLLRVISLRNPFFRIFCQDMTSVHIRRNECRCMCFLWFYFHEMVKRIFSPIMRYSITLLSCRFYLVKIFQVTILFFY